MKYKSFERISTKQIVSMAFFMYIPISIITLTSTLSAFTYQDIWISLLIGLGISIIPLVIFIGISKIIKKEIISDYLYNHYGIVGQIINIIYSLFILLNIIIAVNVLQLVTNVYISFSFNRILLVAIIIFTAVYTVRQGLEVVARTVELILPLFIVFFIIIFSILFMNSDLNLLKPYNVISLNNLFYGALIIVNTTVLNLYFILFIPSNQVKKSENYVKSIIIGSLLGYLFVAVLMIIVIITIGSQATNYYRFSLIYVFKSIDSLAAFARIDLVVIGSWFIAVLLNVIIQFYVLVKILGTIFRCKTYQVLTMPTAFLILCITPFFFQNITEHDEYIVETGLIINFIFLFIIPLVFFIINGLILKKWRQEKTSS